MSLDMSLLIDHLKVRMSVLCLQQSFDLVPVLNLAPI